MKAQISFAGTSDLNLVRKQLEYLVKLHPNFQYYHCFLPRHVVIEKGFSLDIVDLLYEILGDNQVKQMEKFATFKECMDNMYSKRLETSKMVDKMFILGLTNEQIAKGVVEEIMMFTNDKCIFITETGEYKA